MTPPGFNGLLVEGMKVYTVQSMFLWLQLLVNAPRSAHSLDLKSVGQHGAYIQTVSTSFVILHLLGWIQW